MWTQLVIRKWQAINDGTARNAEAAHADHSALRIRILHGDFPVLLSILDVHADHSCTHTQHQYGHKARALQWQCFQGRALSSHAPDDIGIYFDDIFDVDSVNVFDYADYRYIASYGKHLQANSAEGAEATWDTCLVTCQFVFDCT